MPIQFNTVSRWFHIHGLKKAGLESVPIQVATVLSWFHNQGLKKVGCVVLIPRPRVEESRGRVCADSDPFVVLHKGLHSKGGSSSKVSQRLQGAQRWQVPSSERTSDHWLLHFLLRDKVVSRQIPPEDLLGMEEASSLGSSGDFDSVDESSFVITHHRFRFDSNAGDL